MMTKLWRFPPPKFAAARNQALRAGLGFCFPELSGHTDAVGYNPRDVGDTLWNKTQGWRGTPSRHAYCAAFDVMTNRPDLTYLEAMQLGNRVAAWAVAVATDPKYAAADIAYGHIVEVIFCRRIWTHSRGWHTYNGVSPHLDHVHIGLHCPELPDPT